MEQLIRNVVDKLFQQIAPISQLSKVLARTLCMRIQLDVSLAADMVVRQFHQCENRVEI